MMNIFDTLTPAVQRLLKLSGVSRPTPPQRDGIPVIREGKNALIVSPTGSGKTEAAMLPVLDSIVREGIGTVRGVKVLYVTPLRALNRDLLERLENWCKELDLRVSVRHGDTGAEERRAQSLSSPDIIITTPETVQVLLVSRRISGYLRTVRWVIVDEVHELATDKRGCQLAVCLERLREIADNDFQRIGLSATVGSPETLARFLVGPTRSCEVVKVIVPKPFEFKVVYPAAGEEDEQAASSLQTFPDVAARVRLTTSLLRKGPAIVFTNTRSEAEVLSSRLRMWDPSLKLGVHHGSLSRGARSMAESSLKLGALEAIVSTSSLEMGIDVGRVNVIVQYGSPRQVTRLVQRAGRSGHTLERVSRCFIITQDSDDTLEACVISSFALKDRFEPTEVFERPYDVLVQQLAGLLIERRSWRVDDILQILRRSSPFQALTVGELTKAAEFMQSMRPRLASLRDGILSRAYDNKPLFKYYFENLSMIPETRQYPVISEGGEVVGTLDEEFVAKEGEIGKKFILGGAAWKVDQVYESSVYVRKAEDPVGAVPSWVGEEIPVPKEVAQEVGRIRREAESELRKGALSRERLSTLSLEYNTDRDTLARALREVILHIQRGIPVPTDRVVTVESWRETVVVHTHWGLRVNRTLSRILAKILSQNRRIVSSEDAYRVVLEGRGLTSAEVVDVIRRLTETDLAATLRSACEESGFFRIRFMHVARKMGILGREADLTSGLLEKVMAVYRDSIPFEEAWRTYLHSDMDLRGLSSSLSSISTGQVQVVDVGSLPEPSPLASVALEEMTRRGEVMDPGRLRRLAIEGAKVRSLGSAVLLACTNCWGYTSQAYVSELFEKATCPSCGSAKVASVQEDEDRVERLVRRARSGLPPTKGSRKLMETLKRSAELNEAFGPSAIIAQLFKLPYSELKKFLSKHSERDESFYSGLLELERGQTLKRFIR
jgi:ATP-dependent Lhr-like helicase